jgi:hypothetical protein
MAFTLAKFGQGLVWEVYLTRNLPGFYNRDQASQVNISLWAALDASKPVYASCGRLSIARPLCHVVLLKLPDLRHSERAVELGAVLRNLLLSPLVQTVRLAKEVMLLAKEPTHLREALHPLVLGARESFGWP